jgi:hypothetical protein
MLRLLVRFKLELHDPFYYLVHPATWYLSAQILLQIPSAESLNSLKLVARPDCYSPIRLIIIVIGGVVFKIRHPLPRSQIRFNSPPIGQDEAAEAQKHAQTQL